MQHVTTFEDHAPDANGRPTDTVRSRYEIDGSDVGKTWANYRGFNHSSHTFTQGDVGQVIEVIRTPNDKQLYPCKDGTRQAYMCWYFLA